MRKLTRNEIIDTMTALGFMSTHLKVVDAQDEVAIRLEKLFDLFSNSDVYMEETRE